MGRFVSGLVRSDTVHWMAIMRRPVFHQACIVIAAAVFCVHSGSLLEAQSAPAAGAPAASTQKQATSRQAESGAARAYDAAVRQGPLALNAFPDQFPKGADLHVHLSGAVYAETFIRDAAEDGLCVDPAALKFVKATCSEPLVPAARLEWRADPGRPGPLRPAD